MTAKETGGSFEYRFKIDAYSPETMPLARLTEYLRDLSILFGEPERVHLIAIRKGSTVPVVRVEREAEPKVRARLHAVRVNDGPADAMRAMNDINERLRRDNASGFISAPEGGRLLTFPGNKTATVLEYGPFNQPGSFVGVPIKVGGEKEYVPVHLEGVEGENFIGEAKRDVAKQIASYLFTTTIRVEGVGRWKREGDGSWQLVKFHIKTFEALAEPESLRATVSKLRAIPAKWKDFDDPLQQLERIRRGGAK